MLSNTFAHGVFVSDFTLGGTEVATSIFRNSEGNLFVTGFFAGLNNTDVYVMKISTTGTLDNSFGTDGVAKINLGFDAFAQKVALRPDGKIAVAGSMNAGNGNDFFLLLLNADGSKQVSFGTEGLFLPVDTSNRWVIFCKSIKKCRKQSYFLSHLSKT